MFLDAIRWCLRWMHGSAQVTAAPLACLHIPVSVPRPAELNVTIPSCG